ncbi:MAG: helicase, partial [Actinomycetota bacterium]|nr:helicase [Actinomycetota bacterium]
MGLSFLVPQAVSSLEITVRWGDYEPGEVEGSEGDAVPVWKRSPREAPLTLPLGAGNGAHEPHPVPGSDDLEVHLIERAVAADGFKRQLPDGTRSVSLFLVNGRLPRADAPDRAFVFQPVLEVRTAGGFVPRPDLRGAEGEDWDDQVADLHYADTPEYATGHGVSAEWETVDGACTAVRTAWIPRAEVEKTATVAIEGVELSMQALGALEDGAAAEAALRPLAEQYRAWIDERRAETRALPNERRETAEELLRLAGIAADRIEQGVAVLARDADALDAFRVANRAVARALTRRLGDDDPFWRPFQLAFILLNLPGMADPGDPHRRTVDLLFFPTGGGKTEAYLGLSAFAMVLRRLRHPAAGARAGAGVSVIMRYTLRLLTLDQLARAAGLVCALELERDENAERYGEWPFEIGLWVGKAATPNVMGKKGDKRSDSARAKVRQYKNDPRYKASPIPLESCPWCGHDFSPDSFTLLPDDDHPRELRIVCANFECDFAGDRPLPVVGVDDALYRRLPAFVVATVDKFASLPWVGESGSLLGGASRHDDNGYYGAAQPGRGTGLPNPLPPPDLIIQDELHLISGPLGT